MLRKLPLCLCLLAVAACSRRAEGPDVDYHELAVNDPLVLNPDVELSPDGTRAAWSKVVEGRAAIFVSDADGRNPVRLTHGVWDASPLWSPDGRWIAYYSDDNADIWVVPGTGGEPRQLTSGPARDAPLRWLPDGSGIVFIRLGAGGVQTLVAPLDSGAPRPLVTGVTGNVYGFPSPDGSKVAYVLIRGGRSTLWVRDSVDGPARQLTTDGFENARLQRMWSPDGKSLLYTSGRTGTTDLWVADVETGALRQLTDDIHNDMGGMWSPDGRWVLFASDRGGQWDEWVVPAAGGPARRVTDDIAVERNIIWGRDGRTITYATTHGSGSIDVVSADGGTPRTLTTLDGYGFGDVSLDVSPDGRTVLFTAGRDNLDIWSVPFAGGTASVFAASPGYDDEAVWSPDGRQVAFTSSRRGGTNDIWVVPADGGEPRQLTDWPSSELKPRWSPDGSTIAFVSNRDATVPEIWTIPAAGGEATRVTRNGAGALDVRWSPDGRTLFYVGLGTGGAAQVYRIPAGGGSPRVLTHAEGSATVGPGLEISPDGAHVSYTLLNRGWGFVEVTPAEGGAPRRFTTDTAKVYQLWRAWSPDGSHLAWSDWDFDTNAYDLMSASYPDGAVRRLTTGADAFDWAAHWTPDGRSLVYLSLRVPTRYVTADVSRLLTENTR